MPDDELRIGAFKKALRKDVGDGVIDLDAADLHSFNFQIHRYEDVLRGSRLAAPPHRWSYYRVALVKKGEGDIVIGMFRFKATKDTLIVIPSRVITSSNNLSPDSEGYVILFNAEFFLENNFSHQFITTKKFLSPYIRPYYHLTDVQSEEFTRIFEDLLTEKKALDNVNQELIAIKVMELVILGERLTDEVSADSRTGPSSEIIKQFINLLDTHFSTEHTVGFYADQLSLHPNRLNAMVKKHMGLSAKESIQNKLLIEIKYLLHSTELSIKEISIQMGFNGQNYFTTFFKRSENLSPVKYRSVLGENQREVVDK